MAKITKAELARSARIANAHTAYARTEADLKSATLAHEQATTDLLAALGNVAPVEPPPLPTEEPKVETTPVEGVD